LKVRTICSSNMWIWCTNDWHRKTDSTSRFRYQCTAFQSVINAYRRRMASSIHLLFQSFNLSYLRYYQLTLSTRNNWTIEAYKYQHWTELESHLEGKKERQFSFSFFSFNLSYVWTIFVRANDRSRSPLVHCFHEFPLPLSSTCVADVRLQHYPIEPNTSVPEFWNLWWLSHFIVITSHFLTSHFLFSNLAGKKMCFLPK
jgi:hypothetical protein